MKLSVYVPDRLWYTALGTAGMNCPVSSLIQEALSEWLDRRGVSLPDADVIHATDVVLKLSPKQRAAVLSAIQRHSEAAVSATAAGMEEPE